MRFIMASKLGIILFFVMVLPSFSFVDWTGTVTKVVDGDTIVITHNEKKERIHLYGIDGPEISQPFGEVTKYLTNLFVFGETVKVIPVITAENGEIMALIYFLDGRCLNEALVRSGMAWVIRENCIINECDKWLILEEKARKKGFGLWQNSGAIPPREFRKGK